MDSDWWLFLAARRTIITWRALSYPLPVTFIKPNNESDWNMSRDECQHATVFLASEYTASFISSRYRVGL